MNKWHNGDRIIQLEKEFQKMKYLQTITCDNIFFKYYVFVTNNSINLLRKKRIKNIETN